MKAKWYACLLILVFSFFGAIQEQVSIPNQEILLEFVDLKIEKQDIESTIYTVKEKLLNAGVTNINIQETSNGALKISYYSILNVANIKEVLSNNKPLVLNNLPLKKNKPSHKNTSNYNIDIYELDTDSDISNFDGNSIIDIKSSTERFTTTNTYAFLRLLEIEKSNKLFKTAYKATKNLVFVRNNSSYKEPEVRAGPYTFTI